MNISSLIPPEMVEHGKQFKAALKTLEIELGKGVPLDLTAFQSMTFRLPR